MVSKDLRTALSSMVERYGFETVSRVLHEVEAGDARPSEREARKQTRRKRRRRSERQRSAVDYVQAMDVPADRVAVVRRAAEEFERRAFLPTLGDVRSFFEAHGIEEPKSKSRASRIPRIFKFLVTMEASDLEKILDDRLYSGPAQLGPIADAIRDKAKEYRDAAIGRA